MRKIKTIFHRDWEGTRKCIDTLAVDKQVLSACFATEKIDGMNIRVTLRNGTVVRVEKRRNPNKKLKSLGITEPWYVDASLEAKQEKWIFDAVDNTSFTHLPDGEWSAEAFGVNIQGNPLKLSKNQVFVFSCPSELEKIRLKNVPLDFEGIKSFLLSAKSHFNSACNIEGIVWHNAKGDKFKIKKKDFS